MALVHGRELKTDLPSPLRKSHHTIAIGHPETGHCIEDPAGELDFDSLAVVGSIAGFFVALMTYAQIPSQTGEAVLPASEGTFFLCMGGFLLHIWYEGRHLVSGFDPPMARFASAVAPSDLA